MTPVGPLSFYWAVLSKGSRELLFSVLNERHDIQCIGCDIDGEFRPTESLNSVLQFYVNQIKPPLPQIFYQVPDILSCQVS